jgi:hypothetical protein
MITAIINGPAVQVMAAGNTIEITKETAMIINALYEKLDGGEKNEQREFYRKSLVTFLTDPDSPLFEIDEECADAVEDGDEE